jgi:signal transduction histidine kinase
VKLHVDGRGLGITLLAVLLAFIIRLLLNPLIGGASPYLLFAPAVMIAAFAAGAGAGAIATLLSAVLGTHFFLAAAGEPSVERWDRVGLFLLVGALITVMSAVDERARQNLRTSLEREERARAEADAANKLKDRFLAAVSHELQSPATVILGWLSSIRTRRLEPDVLARALDAIERNARLQSRLASDLLDTSRIASGTLRLERQQTDLAGIVRAAADQARGLMEANGLEFLSDVRAEAAPVDVDAARIQQVLTNLFTNATKFTPRGGRVAVSLTTTSTHAIVRVVDTGVGIRPEFLGRMFDQFEQDTETLGRSRRGLGLGLAISHHIAAAHGGTLSASSDGPGKGSTFTLALPLASAAGSAVVKTPLSA